MDKIVSAIQATPTTDQDAVKQLRNLLLKEEALLMKHIGNVDDILGGIVDPSNHTLAYVFFLNLKVQWPGKLDTQKYLVAFHRLLVNPNPMQLRVAASRFGPVVRKYADIMIESHNALSAIKTVLKLVKVVRDSSESLTQLHPVALQLCLISKNYNAALDLLAEEIYEVNPDRSGVNYQHLLLFYYYGGLIYTAVKNYKRALQFFTMAVSIPASSLSMIMIEALKRYHLVSLLVIGKVQALPKHTSATLVRTQKTTIGHYADFSTAFVNNNYDDLKKLAEKNKDFFSKENTYGLIKQCLQAFMRRKIQKLTQTYLTFSIKDLATEVKLGSAQEAEQYLLGMIERGEIFASINQKDGTVSFRDSEENYDTAQFLSLLDKNIQHVMDLTRKVREGSDAIAINPLFIQRSEKGSGARSQDGPEDMEGADVRMDSGRMATSGKMM